VRNGSTFLSLKAPAKINWFLKVIGKRADGYHDIVSLMQCISLCDNLLFELSDTVEVVSNSDIALEDNLVYRAACLLKEYSSCKQGAKIVLQKDIPIGAGLGGGSSDAAHALLGLNKLWGLGLNKKELSLLGTGLGSDVPFFFDAPFALVEGRGEKVTKYRMDSPVVLLLVMPPFSVSTPWCYASFDKLSTGELTKKTIDIKLFCRALRSRDFASLCAMLSNDLEKVIVESYPVVGEIKSRLLEEGAAISAMSGSGPAVFGVFKSKKVAISAARAIDSDRSLFDWYRVVRTLI